MFHFTNTFNYIPHYNAFQLVTSIVIGSKFRI